MGKEKLVENGKPKPLHIYLPPDVHEKLRKLAFDTRQGMSTIVRDIIVKALNNLSAPAAQADQEKAE